jgi:peroxiredoxin
MATGSLPPENVEKAPSKKLGWASVLVPVAGILAVVLVALGYLRARAPDHGHSHENGAHFPTPRKVGEAIEDFELQSLDGKTTRFSDLKAKVILVNFWATWCAPCVREMPSLQKLADTYGPKGLVVIGISLDEEPEKVLEAFRKKHSIRFPTYIDAKGELADRFQVSGLPLTLVLDADRKLLLEQVGDEDWFDSSFRKQFELWLSAETGKESKQ